MNIESATSNEEPQTINDKLQTEQMEVHHHPNVEKKNFKEYFLEFLMIFLAVTMGFFAESYREHLVNNEKEIHYAERLADELKKDTARINHLLYQDEILLIKMGNALKMPMNRIKELPTQDSFYTNFIYFYTWVPVFMRNESTITQLKSAGGFNVIRNQSVVDSISSLDNYYDVLKYNNDWYIKSCENVDNTANQLISIRTMPIDFNDTSYAYVPPATEVFANYDPRLLVQLNNTIKLEESMMGLIIFMEKNYKEKSIRLLNYLQKEYDLKNE